MLTDEQKIDFIYKKVANKEWKTWCRFRFKNDEFKRNFIILQSTPYWSSCNYIEDWVVKCPEICTEDINQPQFIYKYEYGRMIDMIDFTKMSEEDLLLSIETIWNPLLLWDFINFCWDNDIAIRVDNEWEIFEYDSYDDEVWVEVWKTTWIYWENLLSPLEEQNKEFIEYFYNLTKEKICAM